MRALAALAVVAMTGCAQLLGTQDPVPADPVPSAIEGEYLLAISMHGPVTDTLQWEVELTIVDATTRDIELGFTPLDHATRAQLSAFGQEDTTLENDDVFDFTIDPFLESAPDAATAGNAEVDFDATLDGHFPILGGSETATTDAFCGTITGAITAPSEGQLSNTTFAAVKIEAGQLPPPPPKVSCADLGE